MSLEPLSFNPALGHEELHHRFAASLESGRLHHGWLLHGMKGIGKATEAMAMTALYLCKQPKDGVACGECHGCAMLRADAHPDFCRVELLEKKRDINVEQVRNLLDFLSLSGMESDRRVVLIDGAELMNTQAANALLKGLEEPSPGSLLLIICHDLMRLPATIRSRCMLGHCAPLNDEKMQSVLSGMEFSGEALALAIEIADGRPGHVAALQEEEIATALLELRRLVSNIGQSDIGDIQSWLDRHLNAIPNELVADIVLQSANAEIQKVEHLPTREALLKTMWAIAAWPRDVVRHTLRAAPALMGLILEFRANIKSVHAPA